MQQGTGIDERQAGIDAAQALRTPAFACPSLPLARLATGGCR
jgi:hypothetical protein